MTFNEWSASVPDVITADALWRQTGYRLALFASDISWSDVTKLAADHRTLKLSDQLYRAVGSIGANIAEGFSRSSGKDRVRFYEYALGSARESRDWYYKGRHILGEAVTAHRIDLLSRIIRLLLTAIRPERGRQIRDAADAYIASSLRSSVDDHSDESTLRRTDWAKIEIP